MNNPSPTARDAKLWKRLLLVAVIGTVPLFIVSLLLINRSYSSSIYFILREQSGITFQGPLEQLLDLVPRYQAAALREHPGEAAPVPGTASLRQQIDAAMSALAANYNSDLGLSLGFTDAKLATMDRESARLSILQANWAELRGDPQETAARSPAAGKMMASLREMISQAGDFSFQVLDDRLNSYYLTNNAVIVLPRAQQRLSDIVLQVGGWLREGITDRGRAQVAIMASQVRESDQNPVAHNAKVSIAQDKLHGDLSESLYENIPPAVAKYVAADEAFVGLLRRIASGDNVQPEEFERVGWAAREESFRLWHVNEDELSRLLTTRIRYIEKWRLIYYIIISATLALAAVAMGWIIRGLLRARFAELMKNQEELRSSAEKFSKAFRSNPSGLSISDIATGRFIEVNESMGEIYGYSLPEMVGHTSTELGIYRWAEDRERMLKSMAADGALRDFELLTHTRHGESRTIVINAEKIQMEGKECLVSSVIDITEKKRAQEIIRDKQAQLILAMDIAKLTHWEFDVKTNLVTGDENIFRLHGTTSAQEGGLSMSPEDYIRKFVHPLDAAKVAHEVALAVATLDPNFAHQFEHRMVRSDGTEGTMMVRSRVIHGPSGRTVKISGTSQDITEQKRAQEEMIWKTAFLEAQVDSSLDGILVVDDRAVRIQQNQRLFQLFKVPENIAGDVDDAKLYAHVASQAKNQKQFAERVAYLYAHRDEIGRDEIELKDGTVLDRYSAPVRDKAGKYYGRIWSFREITEQRKLEGQLRQAQKMEAIGTLAGGIAHDFNNILAVIMGYTELLQMSLGEDPEHAGHLTAVAEAGVRAKGLVRQILTFSRQEQTEREVMHLDRVVAEAMKFLRSTIPTTIAIHVDLDAKAPAVLADATQVHQIVMNLGTNAWHAMRDRAGRLDVKLKAFDVDQDLAAHMSQLHVGRYTRISVTDTGKGMNEATLSRIFEPFFTTKAVGEGTGLGLSVVHGIMQSHDGAITVYSKPGEGTTFHLYFPAHASEETSGEAKETAVPRGKGERVLYVDDEVPLAMLGKKILERLGYAVETRTNVLEALELVRGAPERFDIVVTDQTMPGMAGVDLAREISHIRAGLPIILTTGYMGQLKVDQLRSYGIREILPKPPTFHSLGSLVHHVLAESTPK
jgi:PAS domain S-box-containing protein